MLCVEGDTMKILDNQKQVLAVGGFTHCDKKRYRSFYARLQCILKSANQNTKSSHKLFY